MTRLAGRGESSQDVAARIAREKKRRKEKKLKRRLKRDYQARITEAYSDRDSDDTNGNDSSRVKLDALSHYGGCRCIDCGSTNSRDLELDHVDGDGKYHRAILAYGTNRRGTVSCGADFYARLKSMGYPKQPVLVVRCKRCHRTKTAYERMRGKNG